MNRFLQSDEDAPDFDLSDKMRAYLAEIYLLAEAQEHADIATTGRRRPTDDAGAVRTVVSTSTLSDALGVTAPAVNRMVNRLKALDLIEHELYQGVYLTDAGQRLAAQQLRRQRIVESFLVQVMGFDWHSISDEAQRLSYGVDEIVLVRMWTMAGQPGTSPTGEPIPTEDGTTPALDDFSLADADIHRSYTVTRLRTGETDRLNYIDALGLLPGTTLEVLQKAPFNGPIQLQLGREYRILGYQLAQIIYVQPASSQADAAAAES